MNRSRRLYRYGFNLVETLVATLILSSTVVTVGALSTRAMKDSRLNQNRERAAVLADRQLAQIEAIGVTQFLEQGQLQGDFGALAPGVKWSVTHESLEIDQLYRLAVTITWIEHGHEQSYIVKTMLNGSNSIPLDNENDTTDRS